MDKEQASVGIIGMGVHIPPDVRDNSWWPQEYVERWRAKRADPIEQSDAGARIVPATPGERMIAAAAAELRDDPFQGSRLRHIIAEGVRASDMERDAARQAISDAGIDQKEIGLVLVHSIAPDELVTNNAVLLHHNLGLSARCLSQ
jgi:hypothetical protein